LKLKIVSVVLLSVLLMGKLFAGGFQLNEHGTRAMGLGGAFTAIADDPSAIYFNGAGLIQLSGWNFMVGTAFIAPNSAFRGVYPAVTEYNTANQTFVIPSMYASYKINEYWAVGIGFNVPFGLGTEWPDGWPGRYLALKTDLRAYTITPTVAWAVDNASFSFGLVYSFATVDITQNSPQAPFAGDALSSLSGKDNAAFGLNLGFMYKPLKELTVGISVHTSIKYKFSGTAITKGAPQLVSRLPNGNITADLTTPFNMTFGVAYDLLPKLKLSADYQYVGWSSYDTLAIDFDNNSFPRISNPRLYNDSYIIRFGAEYKIINNLAIQGGIYFDKNPVKSEWLNPSLPDADRLGFSTGVSYKITSKFTVAASYLFIRSKQLTVSNSNEMGFNGTYNSYANLGFISLSYGL
jgi:long-chain fatty acid transport protein